LIVVVLTLTFSFISIMYDDKALTSRFVVHTGYRTHNPWEANSYPIMTLNETIFTRLYYCMIDAGIGTQVCPSSPVSRFQTCIESKYDCTVQPAMQVAWPIDYSFLTCLQDNYKLSFNVSVSQSNEFLDCLDSSMISTSESIQTSDSGVFLGSYNYVAFLLTAMTIISSFIVATWGGTFTYNLFTIRNNHIEGFFTPFSYFLMLVAFLWNLIAFLFAVGISFSTADASSHPFFNFPLTTSTTIVVTGVLWAVVMFWGYYVAQAMIAGVPLLWNASTRVGDDAGQASGELVYVEQPPTSTPELYGVASRYRRYAPMLNGISGRYLGFEVISSNADETRPYNVMAPLMIQMYAWCWVFADGLFFVGMLTPQNSVLTEDVTNVFIFVTLARLYQLGYAYLFNQAFIQNGLNPNIHTKGDRAVYGVQVTAIMALIASLFCLANALYSFLRNYNFLTNMNFSDSHVVGYDIAFIITIGIAPELLRAIVAGLVSFQQYRSSTVLLFFEFIFAWEWLFRFGLAIFVIMKIPSELKDSLQSLKSFMA